MSSRFLRKSLLILAPVLAISLAAQVRSVTRKAPGTWQKRSTNLDPKITNFIRPGISVKVVSAAIAKDGTITARVKITDPKGLPLDRLGITTPGPVSISLICAYIPAGKSQYVSYSTTTLRATINSNPPQIQAANDSGGTWTTNADGDYTYTFATKAPANFDATATHSIGVSANRDLTEFMEQDEWARVDNDVFTFVPDGSAVKVTRNVTPTAACNNCHDPLFAHGGSRKKVELCILCHTPQTVNPDTLLSQDMPVLIHKIHMGKNLPSVKAGTPYRIWHRGAWSDFSAVGFPGGVDELKTCTVCHQNAPQSDNYLKPSRAACGSCHDDVDFASGKGHVNLPQIDDNQCGTCHVAGGTGEFDATIIGAHTVATRSKLLPGINFAITKVDSAAPGGSPAVTFTVKDKAGNIVDISKMDFLNLVMTGPTADYAGYVSEDARKAPPSGDGYVYTFTAKLPADAKGSYAVGIEGYKNVTVMPGTTKQQTVRDVGFNQVAYFSVDGSTMQKRRQVVTQANCTKCHNQLMLHGGIRQNVEYCVVCHNPTVTDVAMRKTGDTPESINLKSMIHKIHTGEELANDFTVMGHGNSVNNYNEVGYPGDRRNCGACHAAGTYNLPLPEGLIPQVSPRDYMKNMAPVTGACLSCHTSQSTAAHAQLQTSEKLGESCTTCHGPNSEASVSKVHAR